MKKYFLLLMLILLLACGKKEQAPQSDTPPATAAVQTVTSEAPKTEAATTADEKKEEPKAETTAEKPAEPRVSEAPAIAANQDKPAEAATTAVAAEPAPSPKGEDTTPRVAFIGGDRSGDGASVEIVLTKPVKDGFDPSAYVRVVDAVDGTALTVKTAVFKDTIKLKGGFETDREYTVTVLAGIPAADETKLSADVTENVKFSEREPRIAFLNEGILLPSTADRSIILRTMNVTKVDVKVWKVFENNFTQYLHNFHFKSNGMNGYGNNLLADYNLAQVAEEIAVKSFTINNNKNKWVQSALDLRGIIDGKGLYLLSVSFPRDGVSYEFPEDLPEWRRDSFFYRGVVSKAILLTDVALIAQKDGGGKIFVSAMDIVKNEPAPGAKISLVSATNQLLGEKLSDGDGNVVFTDNTKNAFYVVAEYDDKKSLLKLNDPLSMDGFKVGGQTATEGLKAFVYTERGVYRPGDPIHIGIVARNEKSVLPDDHPVKVTVYTPTGAKYIEDAVIPSGKNGFYTWEFSTKTSDNTGIWKLVATIGSHTVTKEIMVETVVPNKIQNTLTAPESITGDAKLLDWSIDSKYLFGSPAAGLVAEGDIIITEAPADFENYKNYAFSAPGTYFYATYDNFTGFLDENGHVDIQTNLENIQYRSLNVHVQLVARVLEESGRPVRTQKVVLVKKFDSYVGIERNNRYLGNNAPVNIKVITPATDGEKLVAGRNLEYRVYYNRYSWWWDYSNFDDFIRSIKDDKETELVETKDFTSTEDPYVIGFVPEYEGEYYVEVTDLDSNQVTGTSFYASDWTDPANVVKLDGLRISTDKAKYRSGEKAVVTFEGTKGAKALVAIEQNGKIVKRFLKSIGEGAVKEEIDLEKSMAPNIYVHVSLLQDYARKNDRSLRLYGTVPVLIEDEDTKLNLSLEAPDSVRPNETFTVKITNDKNKKAEYTVAVVDEGLLDLTAFQTPDPWTFFYQKTASLLRQYDNYGSIMDRPWGDIHQILKVGGEVMAMAEASRARKADLGFEDENRFKPVALWQGVLSTNEKGEGEVAFTMPNYMGSVRIMVVAAQGASYGSAEKTMTVKAPVVVLESLPRTLKVGDEFIFPVKVFALEENIGDIEVYYSFNGKRQSQTVNLEKGKDTTVFFREKIDPRAGLNQVAIGVKSAAYDHEETVGMAVNSNALPIYESQYVVTTDNTPAAFSQKHDYVGNTVASYVTISNTPILGIDQRLRWLIQYPYGCVEQTTSAAMPQLFIDRLMTPGAWDKKEVLKNINAGVNRLCTQFQRSDGGFSYWPGESSVDDWGTAWAATFLINARKMGYYVPENSWNRLIKYLTRQVRERKGGRYASTDRTSANYYLQTRTFTLYLLALAGNPLLSEMNYTWANETADLSPFAKLYLAAAYKLAGEDNTAKEIFAKSEIKETLAKTDRSTDHYRYTYGSNLCDMGVYLHLYHTIHGEVDQNMLDDVLGLLRSGAWYNTQGTAWALLALSDITANNSDKALKGTITMDGVATSYEGNGQTRVTIPETIREIVVTPEARGNSFISYYWEGTPLNEETANIVKGFTLERKYYDKDGNPFNPREAESGKTFWLEILVNSDSNNRYLVVDNVALTQILPTGWEIENTRLTGEPYPEWIRNKLSGVEDYARYTDIRDDRIIWFFDYDTYRYGNNGVYRFFVKINAVTRGVFDFPGTKLEAMYDNNYRSYLNGYPVRVVDKNIPLDEKNPDSNTPL